MSSRIHFCLLNRPGTTRTITLDVSCILVSTDVGFLSSSMRVIQFPYAEQG